MFQFLFICAFLIIHIVFSYKCKFIFTWIIAMNVSMLNCVCILFVFVACTWFELWTCSYFYFILASTSLGAMGIPFRARVQFPLKFLKSSIHYFSVWLSFFLLWRFKWLPISFYFKLSDDHYYKLHCQNMITCSSYLTLNIKALQGFSLCIWTHLSSSLWKIHLSIKRTIPLITCKPSTIWN